MVFREAQLISSYPARLALAGYNRWMELHHTEDRDHAKGVASLEALLAARLHDPFSFLGAHVEHGDRVVRVFYPNAAEAWINMGSSLDQMSRVHPDGVFEWRGALFPPLPYLLRIENRNAGPEASVYDTYDAYAFPPQISDHDLYLFNEGRLWQAYRTLGSHSVEINGVAGVRFSVWAPNAERVSVVGNFNGWDGRMHPMAARGFSGVWELFIPGLLP
ncbi:MAG TPA: hypothetical protein VJ734_06550, partial [Nitrosospira sp.]|nr:hypothetical protein [Nitrosospira sp.]